jgi:hypothetical protein
MIDLPTHCQECKQPHDFSKQCSGDCTTCAKKWMCEQCCYTHECIPGKARHLRIITNPAWICNLVNTIKENETI